MSAFVLGNRSATACFAIARTPGSRL
jgi:hypothetical protein